MSIWYVDHEGGNDANSGSSFALRRKTFPTSGLIGGDTIRVMKSPDPANTGITATWTGTGTIIARRAITLSSAVTATLATMDFPSAWTMTAGSSVSQVTIVKQGANARQFSFGSLGAPGKIAYHTLPGVTNYSAFQQLNFWIRNSGINIPSGVFKFCLCSDTIGNTIVDEFTLTEGILASGKYQSQVKDKGSICGSSIQSIAIYKLTNLSTTYSNVIIDFMFLSKPPASVDCITLNHLISKNTGSEMWWPIRWIDGTAIELDMAADSETLILARGYAGVTETVALHARRPVQLIPTINSISTVFNTLSVNSVSVSGGWNTTDMTTQTGVTWASIHSALGYLYHIQSNNSVVDKLYGARAQGVMKIVSCQNVTLSSLEATGCSAGGGLEINTVSTQNLTLSNVKINSCSGVGLLDTNGTLGRLYGNVTIHSCGGIGANVNSGVLVHTGTMDFRNNGGVGATLNSNGLSKYDSLIAHDNVNGAILFQPTSGAKRLINSILASEAVGFNHPGVLIINSMTSTGGARAFSLSVVVPSSTVKILSSSFSQVTVFDTPASDYRLIFHKYNGGADDYRTYGTGFEITSETVDRHTASGVAWKVAPITTDVLGLNPVVFGENNEFARAVVAGTVTFKIWAKRSAAAALAQIRILGGRMPGVTNDIVVPISGAPGSYIEYTALCTPTGPGVMIVVLEVWSGTSTIDYVLFDDMTWTEM